MSVDISKAQAYAVLNPKEGASVSKAQSYAVLAAILPGVSLSKGIAYAVITDAVPPVSGTCGQMLLAAL